MLQAVKSKSLHGQPRLPNKTLIGMPNAALFGDFPRSVSSEFKDSSQTAIQMEQKPSSCNIFFPWGGQPAAGVRGL